MPRSSFMKGTVTALAVLAWAAPAPWAAAQSDAPAASTAPVDPRATTALDRMSAYLAGLSSFEVTSNASQDLVLDDGHTVKLGLYTRYVARPPSGLYAEVHTDRQFRNFYFDGSHLSVTAPRLGYYATATAGGTLRGLIDTLSDEHGIDLPLADLFLWNAREANLQPTVASLIGFANVGGEETDQYLFVGPSAEWQIWIKRGDQPLPLRMVVTDTTDAARPQFTADLTWNLSPSITASTFTFQPPAAARQIVFGEITTEESDQ